MAGRVLMGVALGVASLLVPTSTRAQIAPGCLDEDNDEVVTSPGEGASDVALNTQIRVRVRGDEQPLLQLFNETAGGVPVPARWQRIDASEHFVVTPESLLEPNTDYSIVFRTNTGLMDDRKFTTTDIVDTRPPALKFGPDEVIDYSASRMPEECDAEPGSYLATVNVPHVSDDGADGSVEILLYLTRASGLEAPVLVSRLYNGQDQTPLSFVLSPAQLATPVCVVADAIDGVGLHADPADIEELCFDPLQGNFFEPCDVAAQMRPTHGMFFVTIMGAWLALGVRRRRLIPLPKRSGPQR